MEWPIAIAQGWHPVAGLDEIRGRRPLAATLLGQPLVLFRAGERITVLRDRCPHRGAPLSAGRVTDGAIACPYHGWRFNADGQCVEVPGAAQCPAVAATGVASRVEAGLVWVCLAETPPPFPILPDAMHDEALDRFWWRLKPSEAGLLDALENHLDPAHPHFIHPWLVRAPSNRKRVSVQVRTGEWGGEAIYIEERRNTALLSTVMEGERARSIGRLWPPTIGEVRLESARGAMLSIVVAFTPVDVGITRPWAHFASTRGRLPAVVKEWALKAFHWPVLQQDRRMLRLQERNRTGERYVTGPLDVLSRAMWLHANGQPCPEEERSLEISL
jgi:phenylpropionate dioxygenase-like ring-hydroxylating dioxygenase large terminal subunit